MRFNKEQLEGFAKVLDNVATAFIVAVFIGLVGVTASVKFERVEGFALCAFALALVFVAAALRAQKETGK